jgi:hypothetical protein
MSNPNPRRFRLLVAGLALAFHACFFDEDAPEGPSAVPVSRGVPVTVEYVQPAQCQNSTARCGDRVIFFGSWMRPGQEFALALVPGTYVWTGTASAVPVNFPPDDSPYLVRVYDPYLLDTTSGGVTAVRLKVGGQALRYVDAPGTPAESGLGAGDLADRSGV